jgi:hypothetical protein
LALVADLVAARFLAFFEAVAVAFDVDDFGTMQEAIDQRDGARSVQKALRPLGEGLVG